MKKRIYISGPISGLNIEERKREFKIIQNMLERKGWTVVRKARELGLEKDPVWLAGIWDERRIMANAKVRRTGNGGQFVKGEHRHPSTEFKPGHQMTPEQRQRQRDGLRVWALRHPQKVKERAIKIWETRRRNIVSNSNL